MAYDPYVPVEKNIDETQKILEDKLGFGKSFDVGQREIVVMERRIQLYYITGLVDSDLVVDLMTQLLLLNSLPHPNDDVFQTIHNRLVHQQVTVTDKVNDICTSVLSGLIAIIVDKETEAFVVDVRSYPGRGPSEPDTEKTVRGSRDGYTENIIVNTALTRRRIRTGKLRNIILKVGDQSKTDVVLMYIEDIAECEKRGDTNESETQNSHLYIPADGAVLRGDDGHSHPDADGRLPERGRHRRGIQRTAGRAALRRYCRRTRLRSCRPARGLCTVCPGHAHHQGGRRRDRRARFPCHQAEIRLRPGRRDLRRGLHGARLLCVRVRFSRLRYGCGGGDHRQRHAGHSGRRGRSCAVLRAAHDPGDSELLRAGHAEVTRIHKRKGAILSAGLPLF